MHVPKSLILPRFVILAGALSGLLAGCGKPPVALQPAALGQGQCQASRLVNSVVAQLAVSGTTCATLDAVVQGAAAANNASFTADGFTCTSTPEGAVSRWAAAWSGTYYAYTCIKGSEQVAFTWGPASQYIYGKSTS